MSYNFHSCWESAMLAPNQKWFSDHHYGQEVTSIFLMQWAWVWSPVESISCLRFSLNCKAFVRKFMPHSSLGIIWPSYNIQTIFNRLQTARVSDLSRSTWPLLDKQQITFNNGGEHAHARKQCSVLVHSCYKINATWNPKVLLTIAKSMIILKIIINTKLFEHLKSAGCANMQHLKLRGLFKYQLPIGYRNQHKHFDKLFITGKHSWIMTLFFHIVTIYI